MDVWSAWLDRRRVAPVAICAALGALAGAALAAGPSRRHRQLAAGSAAAGAVTGAAVGWAYGSPARCARRALQRRARRAQTWAEYRAARQLLHEAGSKKTAAAAQPSVLPVGPPVCDAERDWQDARELLADIQPGSRLVDADVESLEELAVGLRAGLLRDMCDAEATDVRRHLRDCRKVLAHVAQADTRSGLTQERKTQLLLELVSACGRPALVLSGGGQLGGFHIGVVKALAERRLLPRVIAGSSAGALVAAVVCTRTNAEIVELTKTYPFESDVAVLIGSFFGNDSRLHTLRRWLRSGTLYDPAKMRANLRLLFGDLTFQEAFVRTGRVLCVSVSAAQERAVPEGPRLLNYITSPHLVIWSAVSCSVAFGIGNSSLYPAQHLISRDQYGRFVYFHTPGEAAMDGTTDDMSARKEPRRWRDGSMDADLPIEQVCQLFNITHTVVSQANPVVLPILHVMRHPLTQWEPLRTILRLLVSEVKHQAQQVKFLLRASSSHKGMRGLIRLILDLASLLSQNSEGDFTMVFPASIRFILRAAGSMTVYDLHHMMRQGEQATWPLIDDLTAAYGLQIEVEETLRRVSTPNGELGGLRGSSRSLSWADMTTVASNGESQSPIDLQPGVVSTPSSEGVHSVGGV